ncbi:ribosome biogenesis factor YjgA [Echinimonas agarilytica]|uniref:Dual-action ribosomal maturation protein DarP n=1 Tax=Echinimonas agarilytica TaxID=1215918 RepID=A0AA41W510_9GAMM|nr:ribosome biogenesis factor YjgA [Echinimonas agarilytica]MCM2678602.1 ribosome-associated protein [Echinimonas agarilytica]
MTKKKKQEELPEDFVSKTELKRQSDELQALGIRLSQMNTSVLDELPLDYQLRDAIELAQRIRNKREGYRRQLQYIGKLMRNVDSDEIIKALAVHDAKHVKANAIFHQLELKRDLLISEGDGAIQACIDEFPGADRQRLRQLVRSAQREQSQNKPPKSAREIFKYLRELQESAE